MVAPVEENDGIVSGGPHGSLLETGYKESAAPEWVGDPSVTAWLHGPAAAGFDAVLDLSDRPWNVRDAQPVLGVFRSGESTAAYLVVWHKDGWVVLGTRGCGLAQHTMTLAGALAQISS